MRGAGAPRPLRCLTAEHDVEEVRGCRSGPTREPYKRADRVYLVSYAAVRVGMFRGCPAGGTPGFVWMPSMTATLLQSDPPADRLRASLHSVLDAAMRQTGAEAGAICLIDVEANELRFVEGIGLDPASTLRPGMRLPLHTTLVGRAALRADPLIVDDLTALHGYSSDLAERLPGIRALLWLPLRTRDQVIG